MFRATTFEEHTRHRIGKKAARLARWGRWMGPSKTRTTSALLTDMEPGAEIKAALLLTGIIGFVVFLMGVIAGPPLGSVLLAVFAVLAFTFSAGTVTALGFRLVRLWQENRSLDSDGMRKMNEFLGLFPEFVPLVIQASSPEGLVSNRVSSFVLNAARQLEKSKEKDARLSAFSVRFNRPVRSMPKAGLAWYAMKNCVRMRREEKRTERQRATQAARNTTLGTLIRETRKVGSDRVKLESALPSASAPVVSRRL